MVDFSDPRKTPIPSPWDMKEFLEELHRLMNVSDRSGRKIGNHAEIARDVRDWIKDRSLKDKDTLHSWAIAVLEGRTSRKYLERTYESELWEQRIAILLSGFLWSSFMLEALTKFTTDSFQAVRKERGGSRKIFGYGNAETVSSALQQMLEAGVPPDQVKSIASLLWEFGPTDIDNFHLQIRSEFSKLLIDRGWCFPHLLWEIWRQNLVVKGPTHWHDTDVGSTDLRGFWGVFSRADAEPFFDLFGLLHDLTNKSYMSDWEERGKTDRLKCLLESKPDLLPRALPLILSAYGNRSSLILTLLTLAYTKDVFDALKLIRNKRKESALGDISRALITELEGEIQEAQEKWISYWHRDFRRLLTPDFPRLVSATWAQDARAELPVYAAFSQADDRFSRWILTNYALNERGITRFLLDLLRDEGNAIESTLGAWARNRKRQFRIQLKVVEHEPYRREKRTGADIGLILEIRASRMMQAKRACLVQAKKATVIGKAPRPKWSVEREQLERLIGFGDGGLYWLYGLGPGVLVLPARLLGGMLAGSKADTCTIPYSKIATAARPLASFLVYDFISGWIGELSQDKISEALGEGNSGIGPDFILRVIVTVGEQD